MLIVAGTLLLSPFVWGVPFFAYFLHSHYTVGFAVEPRGYAFLAVWFAFGMGLLALGIKALRAPTP